MSRETAIGTAVSIAAVVAMGYEHVLDGDPAVSAALLSAGIALVLAVVVFAVVVPRTKRSSDASDRAARRGLVLGVVGAATLTLIFLGVPFPLAGGSVALGLVGRSGGKHRMATLAVVLGAATLVVCAAYMADVIWNAKY